MPGIVDKDLVIYAGKGGVGKTTCSSATALWFSRQGYETLVVTVDPAKRLRDSLGVDVGFTETPVRENLHALMMDPSTILEEYVQKHAPDAESEQEVLEHPLFRYVSQHMPGLNELLAIGKLMEMRDAGKYERIVVDTAPTGHALTFLSAPQNIKELFEERSLVTAAIRSYKIYRKIKRAGSGILGWFKREAPEQELADIDFEAVFQGISDEADRINQVLTDHEHTVMNIVTIPEKLPVHETIELFHEVSEDLGILVGAVVVNKVQPDELGETREDFLRLLEDEDLKEELKQYVAKHGYDPSMWGRVVRTVEFSDLRRQMNIHYLDMMHKEIPVPILEVPLFKEEVTGLDMLELFGDHLFANGLAGEGALGGGTGEG